MSLQGKPPNGKRKRKSGNTSAVREMAGVKADRVAPKAMTLPELLELIRGGVPNNRLMDLVKERGVKFRLTPDAERQLRQAGAYEKLIVTIREVAP